MSQPRTALIGLAGGPGAGKDAVAGLLAANYGFEVVGFSDALREFLYEIDDAFRMAVDLHGYTDAKAYVAGVRDRLIEVGNAARDFISPTIWTDAIHTRVGDLLDAGVSVAITGVRYHAEAELVRDMGGIVVGVDRPGVEFELEEYEQVFLAADDWIVNHGSMVALAAEVDHFADLMLTNP